MAQLGARLDGIEEVVGSNPIGSTSFDIWVRPGSPIDRSLQNLCELRSKPVHNCLHRRFSTLFRTLILKRLTLYLS